jgi:hypothetical protein
VGQERGGHGLPRSVATLPQLSSPNARRSLSFRCFTPDAPSAFAASPPTLPHLSSLHGPTLPHLSSPVAPSPFVACFPTLPQLKAGLIQS